MARRYGPTGEPHDDEDQVEQQAPTTWPAPSCVDVQLLNTAGVGREGASR